MQHFSTVRRIGVVRQRGMGWVSSGRDTASGNTSASTSIQRHHFCGTLYIFLFCRQGGMEVE
jgi:hypothetical protein